MLVNVAIIAVERSGAIVPCSVAENAVISDPILCMESNQRKSSVQVVIEGTIALASFDVTIGTGFILELSLMGIAMRVATRAATLAVFELDLGLVATSADQLCMLSESRKPKLRVVDLGTFERNT